MKEKRNFDISLDLLRIIATICVVLIHLVDSVITNYTVNSDRLWRFSNLLEGIVRCSVPIFFMLTGALLLDNKKGESPLKFYKNKLFKMILTYIAWTIVLASYMFYRFDTPFTIKSVINNLRYYNVFYHFWFFKPLLCIYVALPILRYFIKFLKDKYIVAITFIWFLIIILMPFICEYTTIKFDPITFSSLEYIGYLLIGYLLYNRYRKTSIFNLFLGLCLFVSGAILTSLLFYKSYNFSNNMYNSYLYSPLSFNIFLSSTGMFLLITSIKQEITSKIKCTKLIRLLSKISFEVFILHPIVICEFKLAGYDILNSSSITRFLGQSLLIILISFLLAHIFNTIKFTLKNKSK